MRGIYLALGGNEGDREANLARAHALLEARGIHVLATSPLYENPALLPEDAPEAWDMPFLNQVIEVRTSMQPEMLLEELKLIEGELGRKPSPRWSPRPIDIDILAFHDIATAGQRLTIPHPEWYKRDFVVIPWFDIAPEWHWHGMSLKQLRPQFEESKVTRHAA